MRTRTAGTIRVFASNRSITCSPYDHMSASLCNHPDSASSVASLPRTADTGTAEKQSYRQILKSSALIGGSSVLNIAIGIIRTKAMAMLLGPAGVGLAGVYGSILDLTQSLAGMGLNSSGVRQIAEASGSANTERLARTVSVLRRTSIVLGALGAGLLVLFANLVSSLSFGSTQHTAAIYLLSIAVFFKLVSAGQGALIQGMRRILDLATMSVSGALFGTLISIPIVYVLREQGVALSLVAVAAMSCITSWWYSRKIPIQHTSMTALQVAQEAAALLKLGFAFMASGLMVMGSAYVVRIIVLHELGFEGTGFYQSAWTLGGLYVGFILQAMGADFYPRLTAVAADNSACNRMVNEQARIGLLLAGPGVIATLTLASGVIALFYTGRFDAAVPILRWVCLGATLRVISWPMGFILLAKGKQNLFFWSELAWTIVYVGLTFLCVRSFGLNGAGIAFFGSYIFHALMIYQIVHRLSGFHWSSQNKQTGMLFLSLAAVVFCGFAVLPLVYATCMGIVALVATGVYSIQALVPLVPLDHLPSPMRRVLARFSI
jgi:enterobacterial common antigen flippase